MRPDVPLPAGFATFHRITMVAMIWHQIPFLLQGVKLATGQSPQSQRALQTSMPSRLRP